MSNFVRVLAQRAVLIGGKWLDADAEPFVIEGRWNRPRRTLKFALPGDTKVRTITAPYARRPYSYFYRVGDVRCCLTVRICA